MSGASSDRMSERWWLAKHETIHPFMVLSSSKPGLQELSNLEIRKQSFASDQRSQVSSCPLFLPLLQLRVNPGHESTGACCHQAQWQRGAHSLFFLSGRIRPLVCPHQAPAGRRFDSYTQSWISLLFTCSLAQREAARDYTFTVNG